MTPEEAAKMLYDISREISMQAIGHDKAKEAYETILLSIKPKRKSRK